MKIEDKIEKLKNHLQFIAKKNSNNIYCSDLFGYQQVGSPYYDSHWQGIDGTVLENDMKEALIYLIIEGYQK